MSRPWFAATAVLAASLALSAHAADPARSRTAELPLDETALRAMFDLAPGVVATEGGGTTVTGFAVDVVIARIGQDGKIVKACVDTNEAAQKFLTAPIEKIAKSEAQQQ